MICWPDMRSGRAVLQFATIIAITVPLMAGAATSASNHSGDILMVQGAPGVVHFHPDSSHAKHSWLLGVEWQRPSRWLAGFAYFNNSHNQKCQYIYGGRVWPRRESGQGWYFKMSGGVILGYKEPYEDNIPYNHNGIAPGIIPALGYKKNRGNVQINLLGTSGFMVTVGFDVIR